MPFGRITSFLEDALRIRRLRVAAITVLLPFLAGGCVVLSSKYEAKTREADTLRDAVAAANKEKGALEARIEALRKQLADEKDLSASLTARLKEQEEATRKVSDELATVRKNYEGTRLTREQLITELLEKEKATGKRIQEINQRAQRCEAEGEKLRKEAAARDAEIAELRRKLETAGEADALRKERDILLGRVERLQEERAQEASRRDDRFAALPGLLGKTSGSISVTARGAAARVVIPEKVLLVKGRPGSLSAAGKAAVAEAGRVAAEFPSGSVVVFAGGKKTADEIRAVLVNGAKLPEPRVVTNVRGKDKGAEIYILVP